MAKARRVSIPKSTRETRLRKELLPMQGAASMEIGKPAKTLQTPSKLTPPLPKPRKRLNKPATRNTSWT